MCGVAAYKGIGKASEILLEGLKNLEYRGYDSAGMAIMSDKSISIKKEVGKVEEVNKKIDFLSLQGSMGIAHTRWSTHGGITKENAHPHTDCKAKIAVVHNGIIENYQELKQELEKNHSFTSETDTEVIPHLIEENLHLGFVEAVKKAVSRLEGRYSIIVLNADSDEMIAVRKGSPLIVGVGEGDFFIASDVPAFLEHTNKVMYLDDNEMAIIGDSLNFFNFLENKNVEKRIVEIDWKAEQAEKGDYAHFLVKEIMEQKETIKKAVNQKEEKITHIADEINDAKGTFFVGCGTAGKACMIGDYLFSKVAKKHVNSVFASEFPNYEHFLTDKTLMVAVSQSGETADVLEAMSTAKKKNVKIVSLLNVFGSSMMRESHDSLMINAGIEKAVVSTKATTAQIAVLTLLAYAVAGKLEEGRHLLVDAASGVNDMLNPRYEEHIKKLAAQIKDQENIYIIGRGLNYPLALEAAIKIQEVSYIHAEGFAGGELKHGPMALIGEGTPCIALVPNDETKKDIINNAIEVKTRGGYIIGVSPENNKVFDNWIKVPDAGNASPIVNIVPIQLLAYHLALHRGCDPDKPKNLAKSVTVK